MKYAELPPKWTESKVEVGDPIDGNDETPEYDALWIADDETITIDAHHSVEDPTGEVSYPIVVEQHVEADGYETSVQTHVMVEDTRRDVEETVAEFMEEVNDGHHVLSVLKAVRWEEFVQFYCIHDSQVPGEMTSAELVEVLQGHEEMDDAEVEYDLENVPDDPTEADGDVVDIDIIPRHVSEVEQS